MPWLDFLLRAAIGHERWRPSGAERDRHVHRLVPWLVRVHHPRASERDQAGRERAELREYSQRPDAAPSASLGSLADKLRGALGSR